MLVQEVRELVDRAKELQEKRDEKINELEALEREHFKFWGEVRIECRKTEHEKLSKKLSYLRPRFYCPYCMANIGSPEPSWGGETETKFLTREGSSHFLEQDTSGWPEEKKKKHEERKLELEQYFEKTERLKQTIGKYKNELNEINEQLNVIWDLCESVLKKAKNYYYY